MRAKLFILSTGFLLYGCAAMLPGDTMTNRTTEPRCARDGLCVENIGRHSIEGGYREGGQEIRFDVAYAPTRFKSHPQNFSIRILNQHGYQFFTSHNGRPPAEWQAKQKSMVFPQQERDERHKEMVRQNDMVLAMATKLQSQQPGIHEGQQEAWTLFIEVAQNLADKIGRVRRDQEDLPQRDTFPQRPIEGTPREHGILKQHNILLFPAQEYPFDPHDWRESVAHFRDGQHPPNRPRLFAQVVEESGPDLAGASLFGAEADRSEVVRAPFLEFTQKITIFTKPAPMFRAFGPRKDAKHSAASIDVYGRAINSKQGWDLKVGALTRNHGTMAETGSMRIAQFCSNFPITQRGFAWKGECQGVWGLHHLCNDDTAYAIWHAYGNWNGGSLCHGVKRLREPGCQMPWPAAPPPASVFTLRVTNLL